MGPLLWIPEGGLALWGRHEGKGLWERRGEGVSKSGEETPHHVTQTNKRNNPNASPYAVVYHYLKFWGNRVPSLATGNSVRLFDLEGKKGKSFEEEVRRCEQIKGSQQGVYGKVFLWRKNEVEKKSKMHRRWAAWNKYHPRAEPFFVMWQGPGAGANNNGEGPESELGRVKTLRTPCNLPKGRCLKKGVYRTYPQGTTCSERTPVHGGLVKFK